jgi:hypothetical protein
MLSNFSMRFRAIALWRTIRTDDFGMPAGRHSVRIILENVECCIAAVRASASSSSSPTSASWLNAVEGFFAKLTRRRLKRGVFRSLIDLQAATQFVLGLPPLQRIEAMA